MLSDRQVNFFRIKHSLRRERHCDNGDRDEHVGVSDRPFVFDFLYAVQSAGFFLAVAAGAVLTALRYIQENLAIGDEVHTMGRDAKRPSLWKRVW